jgi:hypothetical protein
MSAPGCCKAPDERLQMSCARVDVLVNAAIAATQVLVEKRPPQSAASIAGVDFDYFNARLLQYHPTSLFLQPVSSPASVHSA